jgi:glutaredoxin
MDYIPPKKKGYTIYTKKNCSYCEKVKTLLKNENVLIIPCDEYLEKDKEDFLLFIEVIVGFSYKTFPMVFLDGEFIGGFTETNKHYIDPESFF